MISLAIDHTWMQSLAVEIIQNNNSQFNKTKQLQVASIVLREVAQSEHINRDYFFSHALKTPHVAGEWRVPKQGRWCFLFTFINEGCHHVWSFQRSERIAPGIQKPKATEGKKILARLRDHTMLRSLSLDNTTSHCWYSSPSSSAFCGCGGSTTTTRSITTIPTTPSFTFESPRTGSFGITVYQAGRPLSPWIASESSRSHCIK
jgi:hypothetical protein